MISYVDEYIQAFGHVAFKNQWEKQKSLHYSKSFPI